MDLALALLLRLQDAPSNSGPLTNETGTDSSTPLGTLTSFVPFILMGVIFWFMLIAPERKARKKREAMLSKLEKGAKVMTTGGLFGTIAAISDDQVTLQVDEGVRMRFARSAIQTVIDESAGEKTDKK